MYGFIASFVRVHWIERIAVSNRRANPKVSWEVVSLFRGHLTFWGVYIWPNSGCSILL